MAAKPRSLRVFKKTREGGSALKRGKHSRPRGPMCSVVVGHAFCTVGPTQ